MDCKIKHCIVNASNGAGWYPLGTKRLKESLPTGTRIPTYIRDWFKVMDEERMEEADQEEKEEIWKQLERKDWVLKELQKKLKLHFQSKIQPFYI